jgi:hypothetical protein
MIVSGLKDLTRKINVNLSEFKVYRDKSVIITMESGAKYSGTLSGWRTMQNKIILTQLAWSHNGVYSNSKSKRVRLFAVDKVVNLCEVF